MPNHVTNVLVVDSPDAEQILEALRTDDSDFDFNVIVAKPECLQNFMPHTGIIMHAHNAMGIPVTDEGLLGVMETDSRTTAAFRPCHDKDIDDIIRAILNYKTCGHFYWKEWTMAEWGCKWNAYEVVHHGHDNDTVEFQTANSHPVAFMEKLSARYPEATFHCKYADEDIGYNCGEVSYQGGNIINSNIAPRGHQSEDRLMRNEWIDFALRVRGRTDEEIRQYWSRIAEELDSE